MSSLNTNPKLYSARLLENLRDIPFTINEHLLSGDSILKPKQKEAAQAAADKMFNEFKRALALIMPTGTGKTVILAQMLTGLKEDEKTGHKPKKIVIVTDSRDGVTNTREKLKEYAGINAGVYYDREKDIDGKQVIITTYNSWQAEDFPIDPAEVDFLVLDEAHKGISEARMETLEKHENSVFLSLTASPTYDEERDLLKYFELAFKMTVQEAVEHGLISSFRNIILNSNVELDLEELAKSEEGFDSALESEIKKEALNRIGIDYLVHGDHYDTGQPLREIRGIVSCVDTEHASDVARMLNEEYEKAHPDKPFKHGFARMIKGDSSDRDDLIAQHRAGEIGYLVYADLLNQNYDDKKIGVVLNLRLTESLVIAIQRAGRALRIDEDDLGKIALIIDIFHKFVGKFKRQPLFYAHAIGSASLITHEAEKLAKEKSLGFGKISLTRQEEAKAEAKAMKFNITTEEDSILEIFNDLILKSYKKADDGECSSLDIALEIGNTTDNTVRNILNRLLPSEENKNLWYDPQEQHNGKEPALFHLISRISGRGEIRYLKKKDLDKFCKKYFSKEWRSKEYFSITAIAEKLNINPNIVAQIFERLTLVAGSENSYIDPEDKNTSKPVVFHLSTRRSNVGDITCLWEGDLEKFRLTYDPHGKKQEGELSHIDISKKTKGINPASVKIILNRMLPTEDNSSLYFDPNEKSKNPTTYSLAVRRGGTRCLAEGELEKFLSNYNNQKLQDELSYSQIAKELGLDQRKVKEILNQMQPVPGKESLYFDPNDKSKIPKNFHLEVRRSRNNIDGRYLKREDLKIFDECYGLRKEYISSSEISRLFKMSQSTIMHILNNLLPTSEKPGFYFDPSTDGSTLFRITSKTLNKKEFRFLHQDDISTFQRKYDPYGAKRKDEFSALDMSKKIKARAETITNLLNSFKEVKENTGLYFDPNVGEHITYEIVIRRQANAEGGTIRCLKENSFDLLTQQYDFKTRQPKPD